jgi:hypothetical protein
MWIFNAYKYLVGKRGDRQNFVELKVQKLANLLCYFFTSVATNIFHNVSAFLQIDLSVRWHMTTATDFLVLDGALFLVVENNINIDVKNKKWGGGGANGFI